MKHRSPGRVVGGPYKTLHEVWIWEPEGRQLVSMDIWSKVFLVDGVVAWSKDLSNGPCLPVAITDDGRNRVRRYAGRWGYTFESYEFENPGCRVFGDCVIVPFPAGLVVLDGVDPIFFSPKCSSCGQPLPSDRDHREPEPRPTIRRRDSFPLPRTARQFAAWVQKQPESVRGSVDELIGMAGFDRKYVNLSDEQADWLFNRISNPR